MAAITREVLNADGMSLTAFVGGSSNAGIGISGTWVGTVTFYVLSSDNPYVRILQSATPFASGTAVSSTTANGNWFIPIKGNVYAVVIVFTRTSGSVQVNIAAAVDSSWQDAFLTQAQIFNSSSVTSGTNTLTQAAQANRAWNLTFCEVSCAGPGFGGNARLTIYDGAVTGTVLFQDWLVTPVGSVGTVQKINLPTDNAGNPTLVNTPGNAMTIVVTNAGSNATTVNTKFSAS